MITLGQRNLQDLFLGSQPVSKVMKGEDLVWERRKPKNIRYIRETLNGSNVNAYNHWVELQAISNGQNVALNKRPVLSGTTQYNRNHDIGWITNNVINSSQAYDGNRGRATITLDLQQAYLIDEIRVWHYFNDGRQYNILLEVSEDNRNWETIYDSSISGRYRESPDGKTYKF